MNELKEGQDYGRGLEFSVRGPRHMRMSIGDVIKKIKQSAAKHLPPGTEYEIILTPPSLYPDLAATCLGMAWYVPKNRKCSKIGSEENLVHDARAGVYRLGCHKTPEVKA